MGKSERGAAIEIRGFWRAIKWFLLTFLAGWVASWAVTRFIRLDMLIWDAMVALHIAQPLIVIPEVLGAISVVYVWNWSRKSERKKKRAAHRAYLDQLCRDAVGGDKKQ